MAKPACLDRPEHCCGVCRADAHGGDRPMPICPDDSTAPSSWACAFQRRPSVPRPCLRCAPWRRRPGNAGCASPLRAPATSSERITTCLVARTDIGEQARMSSAQRRASFIRSACGTTAVTKPQLVAFLGRDVTGGQHHAHRLLERDHARQALHAAGARRQADLGLGQGEGRLVGRNDDVAGLRRSRNRRPWRRR